VTKVILTWNSSVGIMTGYGLDDRGPIPVKGFFSPQRPDRLWGPTRTPIQWLLGAPSRRVKRKGRDDD
jgi:hypothetical protein